MGNRTNINGIVNERHMHEAAEIALKSLNEESSYLKIYEYIIENELF